MNSRLKLAFTRELQLADAARIAGDLDLAFTHLERAHILSQRSTAQHVLTHLGMLRIGWVRRDWREVFGQMTRIPAAALFSRIWIPVGNTGGANVRATRPMPIPEDLREFLENRADEIV